MWASSGLTVLTVLLSQCCRGTLPTPRLAREIRVQVQCISGLRSSRLRDFLFNMFAVLLLIVFQQKQKKRKSRNSTLWEVAPCKSNFASAAPLKGIAHGTPSLWTGCTQPTYHVSPPLSHAFFSRSLTPAGETCHTKVRYRRTKGWHHRWNSIFIVHV